MQAWDKFVEVKARSIRQEVQELLSKLVQVDRINDEVLEGIHSIPPGIDSFDAESDLVESVLNRDISIDSSPKIDSLSNEFAGELILPKSHSPEMREVEFVTIISPFTDNDSLMEEIDLFLADDGSIPPGIESDDVDSVDDDTSISLPEFESFYVDYPNSGNSTIDVVEDIPVDGIMFLPTHPFMEQDFIPTRLRRDCEDSQVLSIQSRVSHPQLQIGKNPIS
ncbi:hypothetical protein Tco_0011933 [Tanacetum coccineum]